MGKTIQFGQEHALASASVIGKPDRSCVREGRNLNQEVGAGYGAMRKLGLDNVQRVNLRGDDLTWSNGDGT